MANMLSQLQYDTAKQTVRELSCKIELLDYKYTVIDELSGVVLSYSFSTSAESNIRRTGTLSLTPYGQEEYYKIQQGSKIWMDKYIRVYMGIKDYYSDTIAWTNMGLFLINNPSHVFSSTDNTITLQLVDLMVKLTGLRNGYLDGYQHQIPTGTNIEEAIKGILLKGGFTQCEVEIEDGDYTEIQYDIKVDGDRTLYDLLTAINEQNINYQMYFDVDGVFHYNKIPDGADEPIMATDDLWDSVYISHQSDVPYDQLKNHIIVLGKTHNVKNYCNEVKVSSNTILGTCSSVKKMRNHIKLGFTTPSDMGALTEPKFNLNSYGAYPIRYANGNIPELKPDTYYVIKSQQYNNCYKSNCILSGTANATTYSYSHLSSAEHVVGAYIYEFDDKDGAIMFATKVTALDTTNHTITVETTLDVDHPITNKTYYLFYIYDIDSQAYWQFMGELQPRAEVQENNPDSPWYVGGTIGDIKQVLCGGDYDNITTSDLALERAKWELYTRCKFYDSVTLNIVPVYWLDVNWLIEIKLPNEEQAYYIIKNIETGGGITGVQTLQLTRFYPYYDTTQDNT
jgi:hypothetical protein